MLRAHCPPAIRMCTLVLCGVLLAWFVSAPLAAGARSARTNSKKSASVRRAKCVLVAHKGKQGKRKSCAKKTKTSPSGLLPGTLSPMQAPTGGSSEPTEVAPEPGGAPELPVGSGPPLGESGLVGEAPAPLEPVTPAEPEAPPSVPAESSGPPTPFRFFSPTSPWNEKVASTALVDPSSSKLVAAFQAEIAHEEQLGNGPWINTNKYSVPIYTVSATQPTVAVQLVEHVANFALASAWAAVPLPSNAQPAAGSDGNLFLWQPSTSKLWEFWRLKHEAGKWQAAWGGAMQHVQSSSGVYGPDAWPSAQPWWGVSASSLSLVGGLISLEDLQLGRINHALEMAIPNIRAGVYTSPAQRSDGQSTSTSSLPEGAHLRLNPNLNLAKLHLPPITLKIAEAAQKYGIFVTDSSSVVEIKAQDPTPTGTDPYAGPNGYFEGKRPSQFLAAFPWSQLELLKMELHPVVK